MVIYGGQYCPNFNERVKLTKELEGLYKNKVKIHYSNNFLSYKVYAKNTLER